MSFTNNDPEVLPVGISLPGFWILVTAVSWTQTYTQSGSMDGTRIGTPVQSVNISSEPVRYTTDTTSSRLASTESHPASDSAMLYTRSRMICARPVEVHLVPDSVEWHARFR
ncbi:hypothetical protein EV127DRAFT_405416 [Xylaria flabelliformis]|nr:hypothetical protein EV127DRAFT_405416 [Xylaria flabelliformis]